MSRAVAKKGAVSSVAAVSDAAPSLPIASMIERIMTDPSIPMERVDQAFAFYQKVQADDARKAFTKSLVAAQAEMEPVRKDATNPQTRSKYATFEALDRAARPTYAKHGFAPTYRTEPSEKPEHIRIVLTLMHEAGHERDYSIDMPADGKGAKGNDVMTKTHAVGSAMSYGKRYALGGAFNLITTERDDDGNAAGGKNDAPLTAEQVDELIALADEVGADKAKFCKFYQIGSFAEIMQSQFAKAKGVLEAKRKAAAQ